MSNLQGHFEDSSGNILLPFANGAVATIESGSTASQAYTKGALLYFNDKLCKASAAISSGATLAIGTNLTRTYLGTELSGHMVASDGTEFSFQNLIDGVYN